MGSNEDIQLHSILKQQLLFFLKLETSLSIEA
jgi:hypothetical protein